MYWLFKKLCLICRDTKSTNCNQLYTPKVLHVLWSCHLEFSPLHVKNNATSVNTFKSLNLKWNRLNGHWTISITTANLILYLVNDSVLLIDLINAYSMSFLWLVWFGTDVLVSVLLSLMNCLLWTANTLVSFIYTWSVLLAYFYWLFILWLVHLMSTKDIGAIS